MMAGIARERDNRFWGLTGRISVADASSASVIIGTRRQAKTSSFLGAPLGEKVLVEWRCV